MIAASNTKPSPMGNSRYFFAEPIKNIRKYFKKYYKEFLESPVFPTSDPIKYIADRMYQDGTISFGDVKSKNTSTDKYSLVNKFFVTDESVNVGYINDQYWKGVGFFNPDYNYDYSGSYDRIEEYFSLHES